MKEAIKKAALEFKELNKIRVVSHYDADGISAAAILVQALDSLGKDYHLSFVPQLDKEILKQLAKEPYENFIFLDLGSGNVKDIEEFRGKVFILDHHKTKEKGTITHINPHLFDNQEISASGLSYFFCKELGTEMPDIAYIGIVGDLQDRTLSELNKEILENGIKKNKIIRFEDSYKIMNIDVKEFSTLLNACGRLDKATIGVGACLGDKEMLDKAKDCMMDYKHILMKAMEWYTQGGKNIIQKDKLVIINAKDKIRASVIGTICSMISHSMEDAYIVGMARLDNCTKISLRSANKNVDLQEVIKNIISKLGYGEFGGHKNAAGATIPTEKEKEFIEITQQILEKKILEEEIV